MKRFFIDLIKSPLELFKEIGSPQTICICKKAIKNKQIWSTLLISCLITCVSIIVTFSICAYSNLAIIQWICFMVLFIALGLSHLFIYKRMKKLGY